MESIASISGLISQIQWRDLIDEIVAVESRPIRLIESRIRRTETRSSAWAAFRSRVQALQNAAARAADQATFRAFDVSLSGFSGATAPLRADAGAGAVEGSYQVRVLGLAAREKLGGGSFDGRSVALGVSGEFWVNGVRIAVAAEDSLDAIAGRINSASAGTSGAGFQATVVSTAEDAHRLILSAADAGAAGIDLVDGASSVLRALGLLDESVAIKHETSAGARSDAFSSASAALSTLLGSTEAGSGTIRLGGTSDFSVQIDLGTMSLDAIADAINAAAIAAGSAVQASIVQESPDGRTVYRLEIDGTTGFVDDGRVLETLGILKGGRDAVAQAIRGAALDAGGAAATESTRLVDLDDAAVAGDTLRLHGTRGDGTSFDLDFDITADTTLGDVLARLNDADAFGGGARTAVATLEDGRVVVRDGTGGASRLALSIVANNEGGGTLDFGELEVVDAGRAREIVRGADAELEIDGAYVRRSSNVISDAIAGVTLNLLQAAPDDTVDLHVGRRSDGAAAAVDALVKAFNAVVDFVDDQFRGSAEGQPLQPLAADSVLRAMRGQLRAAMETVLAPGVAGGLARLAHIGVEVDRNGRYTLDAAKLNATLAADPDAVARLFGASGTGSTSEVVFEGAGRAAAPGTYAVEILAAAARASVLTAFDGTYDDDGTPDVLRITDTGSGSAYEILLENGMTTAAILDRLNAEFEAARAHRIDSSVALEDALGAPASEATTWADLRRAGGGASGIGDGDVVSLSGTRSNGTTFLASYTIADAATQTVGELRARLQEQIGDDVVVRFEDGVFTLETLEHGRSLLDVSLSVDSPAADGLFGSFEVTTHGRAAARMDATLEDGQIRITHRDFGSAAGFEIAFEPGGGDATAELGLTAQAYAGADVQGTIGGYAATGTGRLLVGGEGTAVDGLKVSYTGSATGAVGSITFARGIGAALGRITDTLLGSDAGSISAVIERLDGRISQLNDRVERIQDRLERRREALVRRFVAMESALSRSAAQSQWLANQLARLGPPQAG